MARTLLLLLSWAPAASGMQVALLARTNASRAAADVPTVDVLPEGKMPAVMCGMGGQLFGQREPVQALVTSWLRAGGRGLDTAQVYLTEGAVPDALAAAGVPREEVFVQTKLNPAVSQLPFLPPDSVRHDVERSLQLLRTSYIDMLLVHMPGEERHNAAIWRELEKLHDEGKIRALGVSNFDVKQMQSLMKTARVPIALNQRKMHVRQKDDEVLSFCRANSIVYQAWGPLGEGSDKIFSEPTVKSIGAAHNRSAAQVALRWVLQRGATLSVQSTSEQHQREDMELFDWSLTASEMSALDALPRADAGITVKPVDGIDR